MSRLEMCRACASLPRYAGLDVLWESCGAQDCQFCGQYIAGREGVVLWRAEPGVPMGGLRMIPVEGLDYVLPGDPRGAPWGFTLERWEGSFLVIEKDRVLCSVLHAHPEGRGLFRELVRGIEASGLRVAVPCPMPNMEEILRHYGFVMHVEENGEGDPVEVWERPV